MKFSFIDELDRLFSTYIVSNLSRVFDAFSLHGWNEWGCCEKYGVPSICLDYCQTCWGFWLHGRAFWFGGFNVNSPEFPYSVILRFGSRLVQSGFLLTSIGDPFGVIFVTARFGSECWRRKPDSVGTIFVTVTFGSKLLDSVVFCLFCCYFFSFLESPTNHRLYNTTLRILKCCNVLFVCLVSLYWAGDTRRRTSLVNLRKTSFQRASSPATC